jgi:probable rRNA maturation factor
VAQRIAINVTATTGRAFAKRLTANLKRAVAHVPNAPRVLSVALVDDGTMSVLHERHLDIPGPTDVLTFELELDDAGRCVEGEVVVCVPEARRRAAERGTDPANELLLYALHGTLHLAGFDDRTDHAYRDMHRMEDEILTRIGIGPVFRTAKRAIRKSTPTKPLPRQPGRKGGR